MSWRTYRVVYQAKSPVHIGWHTLGYINLTRYYIPRENHVGGLYRQRRTDLVSTGNGRLRRMGRSLP